MTATGIITEYNPFHNGHLYHLKETRKIGSEQPVIAVMSGNFTQRGQPACFDKWLRAEMAVRAGVDLVLELPMAAAVRSAEFFAEGALKTLTVTGLVTDIVFGSESGRLEPLDRIASLLVEESETFQSGLQKYLREGYSFPRARTRTIADLLPGKISPENTITGPNNILGIEYLKIIKKYNLNITPHTIARREAGYHDDKPKTGSIASATAIRNIIYQNLGSKEKEISRVLSKIKGYVPETTVKMIKRALAEGEGPADLEKFQNMVKFILIRATRQELLEVPALNQDLVNSLLKARRQEQTYQNLLDSLTSPTYPGTRIQRAFIQAFCRLTGSRLENLAAKFPPYLRVLALGSRGESLLAELDCQSGVPVIINPASFIAEPDLKSRDPLTLHLSLEILASDIYGCLRPASRTAQSGQDFTRSLIKY